MKIPAQRVVKPVTVEPLIWIGSGGTENFIPDMADEHLQYAMSYAVRTVHFIHMLDTYKKRFGSNFPHNIKVLIERNDAWLMARTKYTAAWAPMGGFDTPEDYDDRDGVEPNF